MYLAFACWLTHDFNFFGWEWEKATVDCYVTFSHHHFFSFHFVFRLCDCSEWLHLIMIIAHTIFRLFEWIYVIMGLHRVISLQEYAMKSYEFHIFINLFSFFFTQSKALWNVDESIYEFLIYDIWWEFAGKSYLFVEIVKIFTLRCNWLWRRGLR